ncbi:MAG: sulfatase [bacterium]|nr:sulfatase [bacterium]
MPTTLLRTTLLALAVGAVVGYGLGVQQGDANAYATLDLAHTGAALVWDAARAGALLGGLGGASAASLLAALRARDSAAPRAPPAPPPRACSSSAHDAAMLGPALHASRLFRDPTAWVGLGLVVALLAEPWRARVGARGLVAATLVALAPLASARIELARTAPAPTPRRPNVIVVLLDALRADHLTAYGYTRDTAPFVDALAADGVLFERAFSPANTTRMSVPSFLGSVHAATHGIRGRGDQAPPALLLLPEVLRNAGYQTAAWMPNPSLEQRYRFYYGFDAYYDGDRILPHAEDESRPAHERWETARAIQGSALAWVQVRDRDRPVFLYLHYRQIHGPYAPPPPYDTRYAPPEPARPFPRGIFRQPDYGYLRLPHHRNDVGYYVAQYDGAIRYTSDQLTAFFAALRAEGMLDDALVVLMADHGEAFLEHGTLNHSDTLFDELVHVPLLLLRTPSGTPRGRRVAELVGLVDVAPTVLDYVGLSAPPTFQGRSLRPLIEGTAGPGADVVFLEGPDAIAVRTSRWKVIVDRASDATQVYDLAADPGEQHALPADTWPPETHVLARRLRAHVAAHAQILAAGPATPLDAAQRRRLEALGYVD